MTVAPRVLLAESVRGTPLEAALCAPRELFASPQARVLKDHRRTAVACLTVGGREIYVKRFKPYVWYRRVESLWKSPAQRAWENAGRLATAGFSVPLPLARIEDGGESFFVTEAVAGALPGATYWLGPGAQRPLAERRRWARAAATTLRRFHDAGLYSRDTNANNFLVRPDAEGLQRFVFLDLENVRRLRRVGRRRRRKNLVQLYRLVRGSIAPAETIRFVHAYLGEGGRGELRAWLTALVREDVRKEAEYRARAGRRNRAG